AASGQEEFLTPAKTRAEAAVDASDSRSGAVCMLCERQPSCYTCPRCNLQYCGLSCYQSPRHSVCSEEFYKESVLQELKDMGKTESEGRLKMQEILVGLRQKAETAAGGMEGLDIDKLSEEELWEVLNSKEKEAFMGLMKGGALGGLIPLWKPWWEEHEDGGRALVEVLEEEVSRRAGENSTTMAEQDNEVKTSQEVVLNQRKSATKLRKIKRGNKLETGDEKGSSAVTAVPQISAKIPKLTSLCANSSPLVCYGLVNALFGYTFTLCLYNNDTDSLIIEFCDMILALSEALSSSRVFNSVQEALDCGETLISGGGYLDKEDLLAPSRALEAVAHIATGRDREDPAGYCLAALSQLRSVLSQARKALSKEGEEGAKRQKYFLASKKCEFFQAWVLDNEPRIRGLAIEMWNEHSKRESARSSMERDRAVVEESLKKGKRPGEGVPLASGIIKRVV
uniref:Zinc finger, HIT-type containing 2 n=1 Tax=Gasterosteus aculeatus TaxID=69293 RepID=G3P9A8_GASAC